MATVPPKQEAAAKPALRRHELRQEFLRQFKNLAPHRRRFEVFSDFVTMSALSLANRIITDEKREEEYLSIIGSYTQLEDRKVFPKLLALLVDMLEPEPYDVLGQLYMELEFGDRAKGQFFTPDAVSDFMSRMILDADLQEKLNERPFVLVSEPACGAGGMILSLFKEVRARGFNPQQCLWVQAIDVDRLSALMCYVQMTLWHIPGEVIVGNALTLEVREVWKTPAHHLGLWNIKLRQHRAVQAAEMAETEQSPVSSFSPADQASGAGANNPDEGKLKGEPNPYSEPKKQGDEGLEWDSLPYTEEDQGPEPSQTSNQGSLPKGTQFDLGF